MKTTIDLPNQLFRQAKATTATEGISLKVLVTNAVRDRLQASIQPSSVTAVIENLPAVPKETNDAINQSVAEAGASDLELQSKYGSP